MTTNNQSLNVKLSAEQVSLIQRIGMETISLIGQSGEDYDTLISLITLKMIRRHPRSPKGREMYELSVKGLKFFEAIEPAAPVTETAESVPVIADSAPKMGDTVTGENARGNLVTGKVTAIGCKVVTGVKYVHIMAGSTTHEIAIENVLPGKMPVAPVESDVMDEDTAPVIYTKHDLYQAMKEAEEVYIRYMRLDTWDLPADHITYQRKVRAHINYLRASAAFTGMNNEYLIAYLYGAKNAQQTSDTGATGAPVASQVLSTTDDAKEQEVTVSPVLEGSRKTGVVASFNPSKGYGYIQTDAGETLYFQAQNLKVLGMPISARDRVTFHVMPNFSIEGGMDKATRIMVEGYTPVPRPAYQTSADLVADAKTADMPRKQAARQQRTFKQAQVEKNAASLKRVMSGGA